MYKCFRPTFLYILTAVYQQESIHIQQSDSKLTLSDAFKKYFV